MKRPFISDGPIPGESLVTPGKMPWEEPVQTLDSDEALLIHMDRLTEPEVLGSAIVLMEKGLDIQTMTEGLLRSAVAKGVHTVDTSILIAPVIHEYLKQSAEALNVEYKEGFPEENPEELENAMADVMTKKILSGGLPEKEVEPEISEIPEPQPEAAPRGLMARPQQPTQEEVM